MSPILLALVAAALLLFVASWARHRNVGRLVRVALAHGDVTALVAAVERLPTGSQPTAYNLAVRTLWDGYRRRLAMDVIEAMGWRVPQAWITQFWIRQALEVEPEMAREVLGDDFLERIYQPRVAQQCGSFG